MPIAPRQTQHQAAAADFSHPPACERFPDPRAVEGEDADRWAAADGPLAHGEDGVESDRGNNQGGGYQAGTDSFSGLRDGDPTQPCCAISAAPLCCCGMVAMHRQSAVKAFLRAHSRLHTERFPAYAPELNPEKFFWTQAKRALANSTPKDLDDLGRRLGKTSPSHRSLSAALGFCIAASKLSWP